MRAMSLVLPAQLEPEPQGSLSCPEVTFYFYSLGEGPCKPLSFRSFLGLYILLNFLSFMCLPLPSREECLHSKETATQCFASLRHTFQPPFYDGLILFEGVLEMFDCFLLVVEY